MWNLACLNAAIATAVDTAALATAVDTAAIATAVDTAAIATAVDTTAIATAVDTAAITAIAHTAHGTTDLVEVAAVLPCKVPAVGPFAKIQGSGTHFLEIVCPPQFCAPAASRTASQQFGPAELVLPACATPRPPQPSHACPPPRVPAVPPPPPRLALEVTPARGTPPFETCNTSPAGTEVLGSALLVPHACPVLRNASATTGEHLALPEEILLSTNSTHLPPASKAELVCFFPLGPACLVALAGIELPPCGSTPPPVGPGATGTTRAEAPAADFPGTTIPAATAAPAAATATDHASEAPCVGTATTAAIPAAEPAIPAAVTTSVVTLATAVPAVETTSEVTSTTAADHPSDASYEATTATAIPAAVPAIPAAVTTSVVTLATAVPAVETTSEVTSTTAANHPIEAPYKATTATAIPAAVPAITAAVATSVGALATAIPAVETTSEVTAAVAAVPATVATTSAVEDLDGRNLIIPCRPSFHSVVNKALDVSFTTDGPTSSLVVDMLVEANTLATGDSDA